MIRLEFSDSEAQALDHERYHSPAPPSATQDGSPVVEKSRFGA